MVDDDDDGDVQFEYRCHKISQTIIHISVYNLNIGVMKSAKSSPISLYNLNIGVMKSAKSSPISLCTI